jgi:hypothetical protein
MADGSAGARRAAFERRVLRALRELWPAAGGVLTSGALLAYLAEKGEEPAPRRLYLLPESLQQGGALRLSRADPAHAAREAHGARSIT